MDEALLPIGMISRASSQSIKSLRAYHESGMLVPARVDPRFGYRTCDVSIAWPIQPTPSPTGGAA